MRKIEFVEYEQNLQLEVAYNFYGSPSELEDLAIQIQHEYSGRIFCGSYEESASFGYNFNSTEEIREFEALQPPPSLHDSSSYRLFRTESLSSLELINTFMVGSHNAGVPEKEAAENVRNQMSKIYEKFSFWPYFIDQAGYKCFFDKPISRKDALMISPYIMETGGWEAMINAHTGENFEDDPIAGCLYESQSIFLWWD